MFELSVLYCYKVVNCYMKLLLRHTVWKPQSVAIASTFFFTKLRSSGLRGVDRWMRNVRILFYFFTHNIYSRSHSLCTVYFRWILADSVFFWSLCTFPDSTTGAWLLFTSGER